MANDAPMSAVTDLGPLDIKSRLRRRLLRQVVIAMAATLINV